MMFKLKQAVLQCDRCLGNLAIPSDRTKNMFMPWFEVCQNSELSRFSWASTLSPKVFFNSCYVSVIMFVKQKLKLDPSRSGLADNDIQPNKTKHWLKRKIVWKVRFECLIKQFLLVFSQSVLDEASKKKKSQSSISSNNHGGSLDDCSWLQCCNIDQWSLRLRSMKPPLGSSSRQQHASFHGQTNEAWVAGDTTLCDLQKLTEQAKQRPGQSTHRKTMFHSLMKRT